ncbi:unnamed protein product [Polarella glacialis]|uniref:Uncharacterized protein n=1 Tax=Polarella glacialis TaxID=89957 RepID=A0A813K0Q1_POLGL|nr:unnamed protein product [Polarella glacialis]
MASGSVRAITTSLGTGSPRSSVRTSNYGSFHSLGLRITWLAYHLALCVVQAVVLHFSACCFNSHNDLSEWNIPYAVGCVTTASLAEDKWDSLGKSGRAEEPTVRSSSCL